MYFAGWSNLLASPMDAAAANAQAEADAGKGKAAAASQAVPSKPDQATPSQSAAGAAPSDTAPDPGATGNTALVRIDRFEIVGNTLLDKGTIDQLLEPYKGEGRSYADIQRALEELEGAYRAAGYSAVHVITPEQEVTGGVVAFIVTESVIGKIILNGNQYYDETNIRNALPALKEKTTPSARRLSENIRLANENPTRQIDVVLAVSDQENMVDAKINVKDSSPHKLILTLDNTGNPSTGMYRAGVSYQHNNLFNRDQAATLSYMTSPDHIGSVTQVSGSYRIPLYSLGDSVDLIAAYSDVNAGTTSTVAGPLSFNGQGRIYSARYNHYFPKAGDYRSKISGGLDWRIFNNNCSLGAFGPAGCGSAAFPITVHPLTIAYDGTLTTPAYVGNYNASLSRNIPGGAHGGTADFNAVRPSPTGGAGARPDYTIVRLNGSLLSALPKDWQYRIAGNFQYTRDALISSETLGLAGAAAVRGFLERAASSDKGYVLNLELYTPELAPKLDMENGSLRLLGFIDHARGWKVPLAGELMEYTSIGSIGVGARLRRGKNFMAKLDLANVVDAGGNTSRGHSRAQFSIVATW